MSHHLGAVLRSALPPRTSLEWCHQKLIAKRQPRALAAKGADGAATRAQVVRTGTPHLAPSAVTLASRPTRPLSASAPEHPLQSTCTGTAESPVAPTAPITKCLTMQHMTTTSISISTNVIPRRRATKAWRTCARAVTALTMSVLSRVAGTITIMITQCPRSHHSRVPSPVQLEAAAVRHPRIHNYSNNSNNTHHDLRLPLAGLSVPASPTEARVPVKTEQAQEAAACSPGPRGRAKSLHQYDRRLQYFSVICFPLSVPRFFSVLF